MRECLKFQGGGHQIHVKEDVKEVGGGGAQTEPTLSPTATTHQVGEMEQSNA